MLLHIYLFVSSKYSTRVIIYINYWDLYRSDHYSFWDTDASYSALMLTDTANFRGYMQRCYHKECDDISHVKENNLEFLNRSINAVIKTALDLSEQGKLKTNFTCVIIGVGKSRRFSHGFLQRSIIILKKR